MSIKTQIQGEATQSVLSRLKSKVFKSPEFMEVSDESKIRNATVLLLEKTSSELMISTDLDSDFYNDHRVKRAIERIANNGQVKLLLDSDVDIEEKEDTVSWVFSSNKIEVRKAESKIPHWMISDRHTLRLERSESGEGSQRLFVENADATISDIFIERFNSWWYDNSFEVDASISGLVC